MQIEQLELKRQFFQTLNERQRRHYAAVEARSLGHGGQRTVSVAFDIHVDTIRRGMRELATVEQVTAGRIRKPGGGRKKTRSGYRSRHRVSSDRNGLCGRDAQWRRDAVGRDPSRTNLSQNGACWNRHQSVSCDGLVG